jgi:hypothetical protein
MQNFAMGLQHYMKYLFKSSDNPVVSVQQSTLNVSMHGVLLAVLVN